MTCDWVKRLNSRYKDPQLIAQHCFVASFCRCFSFLTLRGQLDPKQIHLLRVEEMQRADWLICQSTSKFAARQVVSSMKNEQQRQNLQLKAAPRSKFCNNFLQPEECLQVYILDKRYLRSVGMISEAFKNFTCDNTLLVASLTLHSSETFLLGKLVGHIQRLKSRSITKW